MNEFKNEFDKYQEELNAWVKSLGVVVYQPNNDQLEQIITMTREELGGKTPVQLSEDAFVLSQYAYFLQNKQNECNAFLRWAKQVQNKLLGDNKPKLHNWVRKIELRLDRISFLCRRIEIMSQSINTISVAKRNEARV